MLLIVALVILIYVIVISFEVFRFDFIEELDNYNLRIIFNIVFRLRAEISIFLFL